MLALYSMVYQVRDGAIYYNNQILDEKETCSAKEYVTD